MALILRGECGLEDKFFVKEMSFFAFSEDNDEMDKWFYIYHQEKYG